VQLIKEICANVGYSSIKGLQLQYSEEEDDGDDDDGTVVAMIAWRMIVYVDWLG
jgi:hypothetical protein